MPTDHRAKLASIKRFDQLIAYLRDEMNWPLQDATWDELTFDFTADELGIDPKTAAKIQEIKRLRPLSPKQPWGIFFVKFEPRKLPVVALRRILSRIALKKRASANSSDLAAWAADDLLFVSNYGEGSERQISFAHFARAKDDRDLPTLKVLGWDNRDTALHLDAVAKELREHLAWPVDDSNQHAWRNQWRGAFSLEHGEVVKTARELSFRLAILARGIRDRIEAALAIETARGPLTRLLTAFKEALVHDLGPGGFADMYAQTIAYGLLSARITDPTRGTADDLTRRMQTSPFLRELMDTFLRVGGRRADAGGAGIDFDELGVSEVTALLDAAKMEAVLRDFGDRNPLEDPVLHFYESFLAEYDPAQRIERGVFYTPRPVVSFIVRSLDQMLKVEFGLSDGLADVSTWEEMNTRWGHLSPPPGTPPDHPFVQVLDPATGTGTFLVEVIDVIYAHLLAKWQSEGLSPSVCAARWNEYVPKHLLPRLHGYELLMAPYAIAHLKIGLKLHETGYSFSAGARAKVFLTNALEPAAHRQLTLDFLPALAREAAEVDVVKAQQRFTVVLGNPPYAGHSRNNQVQWIVDKVHDYKRGYPELQKPGQAKWLQDDYVKFLRFAEVSVTDSGTGVVGFITNHSWLDNPTFKGMRCHFMKSFDRLTVVDLHGNANKKESAPGGGPDKNVFAIRQGVAVALLRRSPIGHSHTPSLLMERADVFGLEEHKYALLGSAGRVLATAATMSVHPPDFAFTLGDQSRRQEYDAFQSLADIMSVNGDPAPGIVTTQDEFAISFTKAEQRAKVEALLGTRTEAQARDLFTLCSQSQWQYANAKAALRSTDWQKELHQILYRPFDLRWTVYNRHVAVHRRERVSSHLLDGDNLALLTTRQTKDDFAATATRVICAHKAASRYDGTYVFPLWLKDSGLGMESAPNISSAALNSLAVATGLRVDVQRDPNPSGSRVSRTRNSMSRATNTMATFGPFDCFAFWLALLQSASYRRRYGAFLKSEFPRVPITSSQALFVRLVALGRQLIAAYTSPEELPRGEVTIRGNRAYEVEKVIWANDTVWLNDERSIGFKGVPRNIWQTTIGGYQVCEKWLVDRKGRALTEDEFRQYPSIVCALAEIAGLVKEIDEAIDKHGGWPGAFQSTVAAVEPEPSRMVAEERKAPYDGRRKK